LSSPKIHYNSYQQVLPASAASTLENVNVQLPTNDWPLNASGLNKETNDDW